MNQSMLHSGSRGVGNKIGTHFIEKAKKDMQRWHINLPDKDLAYLSEGSEYFKDYIHAVRWAQDFALSNRRIMMNASLDALFAVIGRNYTVDEKAINCHHNYISRESHFGRIVLVFGSKQSGNNHTRTRQGFHSKRQTGYLLSHCNSNRR
ncbi:RtcB family protein [candidate division KSB1 bacterium]|nr:RtcB family protein [candidate division KSB1 bacterium]